MFSFLKKVQFRKITKFVRFAADVLEFAGDKWAEYYGDKETLSNEAID